MIIIRIVLSFSFVVLFLFSKVLQAKEDDDEALATRPANRSKLVLTLEGVQLVERERKVALFLPLEKRNLEAFEESAAGTVKERERNQEREENENER